MPASTLCPQAFILCALEAQQSPRCGYIYVSICHRLQLQPRLRLRLRHRIRIWIRCLPACLFLGLPQSPPLLPLLFIFSSERRFCFASTIDCQLPCAYTSCSFLLSFLCSARFVFVLPVSVPLSLYPVRPSVRLSVRLAACPPACLGLSCLESFTFYCRIILSRLAQTQRFTTKSSSLVTLTQTPELSPDTDPDPQQDPWLCILRTVVQMRQNSCQK